MLVLSRKQNQKVVFPNLDISVEILRIKGNAVSVGVDAPRDISILRGELVDDASSDTAEFDSHQRRHELRNRLNSANLALHIAQQHLAAANTDEAEQALAKALESLGEIDRQLSRETPKVDSSQRMPRALVVDDNDNERELLSGYLRLCGYQVESVEDGFSAMTYLATHHAPDVVLLDMHMPRMDGPATVSAIRCDARYRNVKLCAVSGSPQDQLGVPIGDQGVDRWFAKPLNPVEFANELTDELNSDRAVAT